MAGGPNAEFMACMVCLDKQVLTKAERVIEGEESDQYFCELNHQFGFTFSRGPAREPTWPPPQSVIDACKPPS